MAIEINYTDDYTPSTNYPNSYWRVSDVYVCKERSCGTVSLGGYQDAAHKGGRMVGTKMLQVQPPDIATYFSPTALKAALVLGNDLYDQAYAYAKATNAFFASGKDV